MTVILIDRNARSGAYLEARMVLFTLGALLALAGMASERVWLVWVATIILLLAFVLRFGSRTTDRSTEGSDATEGPGDSETPEEHQIEAN